MFLIVFKALFTKFCNCACAKKIVMLIRILRTYVALLHKKTVLSLETSSEINFELIKFLTITQSENAIFILLYRTLDPLFSTVLGLPW